jgi:hypothetical protein
MVSSLFARIPARLQKIDDPGAACDADPQDAR